MDIQTTLTIPPVLLTISLFILLISWLVVFTYLALRPMPEKHIELLEPAITQPVVKPPAMQTLPITPRATNLRSAPVTQQTPIVTVSVESNREMVLDHSTH